MTTTNIYNINIDGGAPRLLILKFRSLY
ncbi:hypothetical protein SBA4_880007 [Candidatus Sulfopaludibacter sp. SbA4]|nr:hypothetical protein SBA4_880007 [Candidatus Sulfopaludibacter sp. SbA4]